MAGPGNSGEKPSEKRLGQLYFTDIKVTDRTIQIKTLQNAPRRDVEIMIINYKRF